MGKRRQRCTCVSQEKRDGKKSRESELNSVMGRIRKTQQRRLQTESRQGVDTKRNRWRKRQHGGNAQK